MYIITARWIASGKLLKLSKGLRTAGGYGAPALSQFGLIPLLGSNNLIQLNAPSRKLMQNSVLFMQFKIRAGLTASLRIGSEISCSGGETVRRGPSKL